MLFRYSRWDGRQQVGPYDPDAVMDSVSDELISGSNLRAILQRMLRHGPAGPDRTRHPGLENLIERLRKQRKKELERYDLNSVLDDIQKRLDKIVETERAGIDRRVAEGKERARQAPQQPAQDRQDGDAAASQSGEAQATGTPGEPNQPDNEQLQQMLERIAEKKRQTLDKLPKSPAGAIKELSQYEFMDDDARQQFQELLAELQKQMMQQYFQGVQQALQDMTPQDMQRLRNMVRDLNRMLQEKQQGGEPNFGDFMQQYGDMFPDGIESLDQMIDHLGQQMAQMQSLLASMSPSQRQALQDLMDTLLRDDRLKWDLAQLAANLEELLPMRDIRHAYEFEGPESLTLARALGLMERLQDMDELEQQLRSAMNSMPDLEKIDGDKLRELVGKDAEQDFERLRELMKALEEAGYVQRKGESWELTPRGLRRIGQKALRDIFSKLSKDRLGQHEMDRHGSGSDRVDDSKPYAFGDAFHLDLQKTLMNAVGRGAGSPIKLTPVDFEVYRTELLTQCATVLMLDLSRSMVFRGCLIAAKKVAIALNSLIHTQFPRDDLYVVVFAEYAKELKAEDLPRISVNDSAMGTNLHHGLMLARRLLARHKSGTRQIIVITDGEPTAHLMENGYAHFDYPPDPVTIEETLKEVLRCTREKIVINTFMLERNPYLKEFVDRITHINRGRAFFATPERLGEYVLVDYVANKSRQIS